MDTTLQIEQPAVRRSSSQPTFRKTVLQDFLQMTVCVGGAVFAVYFAPSYVNYLYFLVLLGIFWRSKSDYFWFAFFYILINTPANLFFETSAAAARRLPLYSFVPGVGFAVFDLFILLGIAKVLYFKRYIGKSFTVSTSARFLLFYVFLVSVPMSFILGFEESSTSFLNNFRPYFYYTLVIPFFFLIDKPKDIYMLGYLTVPYVLVTLFDQLYLLTTGDMLASLVNPETVRHVVENTITGGARAYFTGYLLLFYAFYFGLQLRMNPKYEVVSGFGYLVIILTFTAFLLSATRSYLMMPLMALFGYLFYSKKAAPDLIKLSVSALVFAVIFFSLDLISWESFLKTIWPRFEAFFNVILGGGGDLQKFDTVGSRLDSDLPELLKGISYSPFVGAGFSGWFRKYINDDLGFLNSILVLGWVGFAFLLNFLIFFLKESNNWAKKRYADKDSKTILNSIAILFFGILLGYATTYDFFTVMQVERIYFISMLVGSAEVAAQNIQERKKQFFKHKILKT